MLQYDYSRGAYYAKQVGEKMGLDLASIELLCCAKSIGVDFSETLMIGRQTINDEADALASALSAIGVSSEDIRGIRRGDFGEPLFRLLGARHVYSLDASDYEQATYICDLNRPHPAHLSQKFSVVHDGGALEHVFNLPQALKNCMEMVRVRGHFIQVAVANNFMGHGFWQLSPEAIYRALSAENGFSIEAVFLHEVVSGAAWYRVADPADDRWWRVELVNHRPTYICTIAKRVADKHVFAEYPQQSDYVEAWQRTRIHDNPLPQSTSRSIRQLVPKPVRKAVRAVINAIREPASFDRPYYRYVSTEDLVHGRVEQADAITRRS